MTALDVNALLGHAELAFNAGKLGAARADLARLRQLVGDHPAVLHLLALVERKSGDNDAAREAFIAALRVAPEDPQINSNFANLLAAAGDSDQALRLYERAIAAAPDFHDARFNRAILLQKLGRFEEALRNIDSLLAARPREARFLSAQGALLRELNRLGEAAQAFDTALAQDPKRVVALRGRARVALERGEEGAVAHYERALAVDPASPELILGLAEALEFEGRAGEAIDKLSAIVEPEPTWIDGQILLARMRWEAGEGRAFTQMFEAAARSHATPQLWGALASTLAGADLFAEAAEAAAAGAAAAGGNPALQLMEAHYASESGQLERADRLFAGLPAGLPARHLNEARHALKTQRYDQASQLLDRARDEVPWGMAEWALTGLTWRLTGDARAAWLNEQPGFVSAATLDLSTGDLARIADRLRSIHRTRAHPIAQSLRGGTQTRGRLFERIEPEIRQFADSIKRAVESYWAGLPAMDATHPLLRHREHDISIQGSWSVRLTGGGFHVAHFHSKGIVSSATYLAVPKPGEPMEGWLEIGAPPAELGLPLEPLTRIEPVVGRLALFPSYMLHGTRPFSQGERLTAAFDVVPA
jgi:tetratricopeptide (TPR) repeat protein